jgi:FAD/FMN-containing dehydrogenase/Fe-S oxidoreductase
VTGDVRFDEYAQVLYATDGSIYQARPAGVVCPRDVPDVRAAVETAAEHDVPVVPRGAGTSLAGQGVGPGCLLLDCSVYMDEILDVAPDRRRATVQPGVVQDDLDDHLAEEGLKFAPDPASSNRATIGGGIGNNSTGAHSVRYGITDAYVESVRVVLSNVASVPSERTTRTDSTFEDVVLDSPEWDDLMDRDDRVAALHREVRAVVEDNEAEISERFPELQRSVSGYNLHEVVREKAGDRVLNLAKLVVGAEGTLGVVVEAELSLVTRPSETALVGFAYDDLLDALAAVPIALDCAPSAVELIDDQVVAMARDAPEYAAYAEPIPDRAGAILLVEFDDECHEDFAAAVERVTDALGGVDPGSGGPTIGDGTAERPAAPFDRVEAYDDDEQARLWKLRKAAIPLLMSMDGDPKPYPFIEDASVPPNALAEYVDRFETILEDHGTSAAYFAHAGSGTLHIRPVLNLKESEGIETMHAISEDVTDLVLEYGGAFSGEHGDGMARTEFTPKLYGDQLWGAFKRIKTAFDPDWLFHPGNVVYRDGLDDPGPDSRRGVGADMRENLRYGPAYESIEPQTTLDFDDDGGFSHLVELCNGCGTCRQTGSDTMCPSYRATGDEIDTTRGRANLLRAAISGELPPEELYDDEFQSAVLDRCLGCKGCLTDCPTGVDLAKLKAEVKHEYHEEEGFSLRDRLFANADRAAAVGSLLAPVSNWLAKAPGSGQVAERVLGVAAERDPPPFRRTSFAEWFADRGSTVPPDDAAAKVVLLPDTYTNYSYPGVGRATVRLLEAADVHVQVPPDLPPSGRAAHSIGALDRAADRARETVDRLAPLVEDGWSVCSPEPSDVSVVCDDYRSLLSGEDVDAVADETYGVTEFLDRSGLDDGIAFDATDERLTYHGHCHAKALGTARHAPAVLRRAGFDVDVLDTGCCGMAGSFGYEAERYDLSVAIGEICCASVAESEGDRVVAPGSSCRTQLSDLRGDRPDHPVEVLAGALSR